VADDETLSRVVTTINRETDFTTTLRHQNRQRNNVGRSETQRDSDASEIVSGAVRSPGSSTFASYFGRTG
jgi:hypothetical protein